MACLITYDLRLKGTIHDLKVVADLLLRAYKGEEVEGFSETDAKFLFESDCCEKDEILNLRGGDNSIGSLNFCSCDNFCGRKAYSSKDIDDMPHFFVTTFPHLTFEGMIDMEGTGKTIYYSEAGSNELLTKYIDEYIDED